MTSCVTYFDDGALHPGTASGVLEHPALRKLAAAVHARAIGHVVVTDELRVHVTAAQKRRARLSGMQLPFEDTCSIISYYVHFTHHIK